MGSTSIRNDKWFPFLLGKTYDIKKIYLKNILRLLTAFFFWSAVYVFVEGGNIIDFLTGHYHMWFIPMIGWLYICIPMIQKLVETEKTMKYFLGVAFLFSFLFPQIAQVVNDFGGVNLIEIVDVLDNIFVLSNLIVTTDTLLSVQTQVAVETYGGNFSIPVLLQSIAIFVWIKYTVSDSGKFNGVMHQLARYSFGAYLIHALIIEQLALRLGWDTLVINPLLSVPMIGIVVFVISFAVSAIIHKIPFLNKYIV